MMKKDLIDPKDIDLILNTHCHPDHCESNEIFSKISGARIGMHEIEANYLKNDARLLYEIFNFPFPDFKIDLCLKNSLKLNNSEIEIIHTPGHSPGSVCLYFNEDKTLICGDLIFERSFGRTDLPGGEPTLIKKSIERISNLDIELLLPGHGNFIKGKKNVRNNFDFIKKILNYV